MAKKKHSDNKQTQLSYGLSHSEKNNKSENQIRTEEQIQSESSINNESNLIRWLKRIFSFQTLTVVATIVAAYYGYKTYSDNQPSQISMVFTDLEKLYDVQDKSNFMFLFQPSHRCLLLETDDDLFGGSLPIIVNDSEKSIIGFKMSVNVYCFNGVSFKETDVNKNFTISKLDTADFTHAILDYKYDVLHAKSSVSSPLNTVFLPDSISLSDDFCHITFEYNITYEGINAPIHYFVNIYACFNDDMKLSDNTIDAFLSMCFKDGVIFKESDHTFISMHDTSIPIKVIKPIDRHIKGEEFEKYKSDIISSVSNK